VVIAYLPVIRDATYIWDDARYVTENPTLPDPDGLRRIWLEIGATIQYYPLVFSSFWLEYRLWELDPGGYHLVNVLLHALSALLLWQVLRRLRVPGAWLVGAVFAVHPIQVESVAWIAERKNVLSGFFYLAALLCYLRFALPEDEAAGSVGERRIPQGRPGFYALSLVCFLLALASKTVTCSLPAVMLLILWWKRDRLSMRDVLPLVPMFVVGVAAGMLTTWMEKHNVHAQGADWDYSLIERVLIAGRALWFYVGKLLVPYRLTFNYPLWTIDSSSLWQWLFPLAFLVLVVVLWLVRGRFGKAPLVAVLIYGGTLVPALGFIDVYPMRYAFVADHFQYLAGVAVVALMVAGLARLIRAPGVARLAALAIVVVLVALTWRQGVAYQDRATLWRDTIAKNPGSFLAHCNLGGILLEEGRAAEALPHLTEAVRLKPDMHEAHGSLGRALVELGRAEEGKAHYREAIRVKPTMAWAYQSLATALADDDSVEAALDHYRRAIELDPDFVEAHYNQGNLLARQGRTDEAVAAYDRALALDADQAAVHLNLGSVLAEADRLDEAVVHFREAVRLDPDYGAAHRNLGIALARQGHLEEAIESLWLALRADHLDPVAHYEMAEALRRSGKIGPAVNEYRRTLMVDPDHAGARQALQRLGAPVEPETGRQP
jgi:tetratricopeptide (TPR) repeat protein